MAFIHDDDGFKRADGLNQRGFIRFLQQNKIVIPCRPFAPSQLARLYLFVRVHSQKHTM